MNTVIKFISISSFIVSVTVGPRLIAAPWTPSKWPVIKHYDQNHLRQISLPLGGIGTGVVGLGGRGELRDWEIMNVPGVGYSTVTKGNLAPFFSIYVKEGNKTPICKMLAGKLYDDEYLAAEGRSCNHHGLPRFANSSFDAAYPFGIVNLTDSTIPVRVRIKGFNPLVPGDEEISGLPIAILSYEVTNLKEKPIEVAVCGSIRNFIGKDGSEYTFDWKGDYVPKGNKCNRNLYKEDNNSNVKGIYFFSEDMDNTKPAYGNMSLTTDAPSGISYRLFSADNSWEASLLNFWDDFSDDGNISSPSANNMISIGHDNDPMASLSVKQILNAHETKVFNFYLTWNFPNRKAWSNEIVGNWYSKRYPDSFETAKRIIKKLPEYELLTLKFVNALAKSSYPDVIKEAALFNLNVLRSQTVFRLPSGHLMGWEGTMDRVGSCKGSCTHVWNYEVATPYLFGHLAQTMREVETEYATHDDGSMAFRVSLPLQNPDPNKSIAADGQMGCIMKFYREWQFSGNNEFLKRHWSQVKKNLSYAWVEKGWDSNQDGVMEGSQHNTMDVNYFGPNPQMGFWYLGALRATEEMAKAMKEKDFAQKCNRLYEQGRNWMNSNLFNGEYYEQKITNPADFEFLPEGDPKTPPYQLGKGCLVDQLVGQYMAHLCNLGYLTQKENIVTTLKSVKKYNFKEDFSNHFNNMRSYVLGNEAGLLMASWPKGRLQIPFPYFNEAMTGFEYVAAIQMIQEGLETEGLQCIKAIRDRFDGSKRNPFSEPECGHHYARSMASWAAIPAYSGFQYSGVDKSMKFGGRQGTWFWSNGYSWGTIKISPTDAELKVLKGNLLLHHLTVGQTTVNKSIVLNEDDSFKLSLK